MKIFSLVLSLILSSALVQAEVFSSVPGMKNVFKIEQEITNLIQTHVEKLEAPLNDKLAKYLQEIQGIHEERKNLQTDEEFEDAIIGNPIHTYKMMKRFNVDLKKIEAEVLKGEEKWEDLHFEIKRKRLGNILPSEEDLHGAAKAIVRLQETYELNMADIIQGKLVPKKQPTIAKLAAKDALFFGKHCFNNNLFSRSIEWFEEAWALAKMELEEKMASGGKSKNETLLTPEKVFEYLDKAAKTHDVLVMKGEKGDHLFPKPVHIEPPTEQRQRVIETVTADLKATGNIVDETGQFDAARFKALCRGEELRDQDYVAKLKCDLRVSQNDPFFALGPMKVEILHLDPMIEMYYDVVSQGESRILREVAGPMLMRSAVQGDEPGSTKVSEVRTSKTGWLQDHHHPKVREISLRVKHITGLKTDASRDDAELLQIANYINGGHYNTHHDYVMKERDPDHMIYNPLSGMFIGDRLATWLFYLNQVPAGGKTVFPRIGAAVEATEGAAVFWYNLKKSGGPDRRTLHGACPVIYGTKWISNKWIREGTQMLEHPCGLTEDE